MVVLGSSSQVKSKGLKPLAKIINFAEVGVDPMLMGIGPIGAVNKLVSLLSNDFNFNFFLCTFLMICYR